MASRRVLNGPVYIPWLYKNLFREWLHQFHTFLQPDNIVVCSLVFLPYVLDILLQVGGNFEQVILNLDNRLKFVI